MKRIFKTLTALAVTAAMIISIMPAVFADSIIPEPTEVQKKRYNYSYTDVPETHWAHDTIIRATADLLVNGYPDGTFGPEKTITKLEFLFVVGESFYEASSPLVHTYKESRTYVETLDLPAWAKDGIMELYCSGVLTENDTELFDWNAPITRAEVAKVITRVAIAKYRHHYTNINGTPANIDEILRNVEAKLTSIIISFFAVHSLAHCFRCRCRRHMQGLFRLNCKGIRTYQFLQRLTTRTHMFRKP